MGSGFVGIVDVLVYGERLVVLDILIWFSGGGCVMCVCCYCVCGFVCLLDVVMIWYVGVLGMGFVCFVLWVLNKQRRRGVCSFRRLRGAATYSSTCVVPSAWTGLTALFGMGRGGAPSLWPPESFLTLVWKQLCMGGNGYICFCLIVSGD